MGDKNAGKTRLRACIRITYTQYFCYCSTYRCFKFGLFLHRLRNTNKPSNLVIILIARCRTRHAIEWRWTSTVWARSWRWTCYTCAFTTHRSGHGSALQRDAAASKSRLRRSVLHLDSKLCTPFQHGALKIHNTVTSQSVEKHPSCTWNTTCVNIGPALIFSSPVLRMVKGFSLPAGASTLYRSSQLI